MILLDILNPANKTEAGIALFLLLLGAAIIGFVVAWLLRGASSSNQVSKDFQAELEAMKSKVYALDKENVNLLAKNNRLQNELTECLATKQPEFAENGNISAKDLENASRLGFKPASVESKDDLKRIHGVGPFIEKKLNNLGIYTFEQISEFDNSTINKVTEAIEFFPGRIKRDNWVKQAREMMNENQNINM